MPVDLATTADGTVRVDLRPGAAPLATVLGPLELQVDQGGPLHTTHFATCPDADTWRHR